MNSLFENIEDADELKSAIRKRSAVVYGTGYVAKRFYRALEENGLTDKIEAFVTTKGSDEPFLERRVLSLDALATYTEKTLILIAVHESLLGEIQAGLREKGITDSIWIYPYLYELILGDPIETGKEIPVRKILETEKENYQIAVRMLAIDEYHGKSDAGYSVYRKLMGLQSPKETIEKRLQSLIRLIKSFEKSGYDRMRPTLITESKAVIDGIHRISVAASMGMQTVCCNIYREKITPEELFGADGIMKKTALTEELLTEYEWKALRRKQESLYE